MGRAPDSMTRIEAGAWPSLASWGLDTRSPPNGTPGRSTSLRVRPVELVGIRGTQADLFGEMFPGSVEPCRCRLHQIRPRVAHCNNAKMPVCRSSRGRESWGVALELYCRRDGHVFAVLSQLVKVDCKPLVVVADNLQPILAISKHPSFFVCAAMAGQRPAKKPPQSQFQDMACGRRIKNGRKNANGTHMRAYGAAQPLV